MPKVTIVGKVQNGTETMTLTLDSPLSGAAFQVYEAHDICKHVFSVINSIDIDHEYKLTFSGSGIQAAFTPLEVIQKGTIGLPTVP